MKYLMYIAAFLFCFTAFAQEKTDTKNNNPKDVVEETKVKTMKVEKNGKVVSEKKVAVTTKKEQEVKTAIEPDHYENSTRLDTPVKVTKTVKIDSDNDPFFDSETTMVTYKMNDQDYAFTRNDAGFIITFNGEDATVYGNARLTSLNGYYLLNADNFSGIGYFNSEGNFVVEYYDETLNAMVIQEFEESKF